VRLRIRFAKECALLFNQLPGGFVDIPDNGKHLVSQDVMGGGEVVAADLGQVVAIERNPVPDPVIKHIELRAAAGILNQSFRFGDSLLDFCAAGFEVPGVFA
jgi:hypothetical protein